MEMSDSGQADQALWKSEHALRLVADNALACISYLDAGHRYRFVNKRYTDWFGLLPDEIVGKHIRDVLGDEVYELTRGRIEEALSGRQVSYEELLPYSRGVPRWVMVTLVPDLAEKGRVRGYWALVRDITERKRADRRLRTEFAVTRVLAERPPVVEAAPRLLEAVGECLGWELGELWLVDLDANVLRHAASWHSPALDCAEFTAFSRQLTFSPGVGIPGRVWASGDPMWVPDVTEESCFQRAPVTRRLGLRAACAFPIRCRKRVVAVAAFFGRQMRQPDADLLELLTDVMNRIGLYLEYEQTHEEMERQREFLLQRDKVAALGSLAAGLAHEINQPLGAVVINAQACLRWLAAGPPNLDEARAAVTRIIRDGKRASDVIARMRSLLKRSPPAKTRLEVSEVIEETIALVRPELARHRVSLRTSLSDDLPPVLGDRVQVQQVLFNLIMNGIEAMNPVTDRPRELEIRAERHESGGVLVAVTDAGIGLDPATTGRIFEVFFTTRPDGMGLGLSISRSIVEGHGGRLWVTPNADHGATFQFTLPTSVEGEA